MAEPAHPPLVPDIVRHVGESYDNLILVQSVRTQPELAYEDLIRSFDKSEYYAEHAHKLRYARIVTRDRDDLMPQGQLRAGLPRRPDLVAVLPAPDPRVRDLHLLPARMGNSPGRC